MARIAWMNLVKEIAGILLGKEAQGTLKAHMVRGTVGTFVLKVANTVLALGTSLLPARVLGLDLGTFGFADREGSQSQPCGAADLLT